jgi:hypothetical protein
MGTYIYIQSEITVKKENEAKAVQAVRDLNKRDDLKRGGSSKGEKWFSWIPEKYEDQIENISDIFVKLHGWEESERVETDDTITYSFHYNDKWGQHEVFFVAMAPYLESFKVDHLCDEFDYEEQKWTITMDPVFKTVHELQPKIIVEYPPMYRGNQITLDTYIQPNYDWMLTETSDENA